ncbi:MAG: anti-sigma factor family protein [Luteolibacter sp.]
MHSQPEDPQITAYVLGELSPEDAAAVEHAARTSPAIQEKIEETREIQRFLKDRLTTPTAQLLPRQRENIRRSAQLGGRSFQPWLIPAAAAAVLALATFIMIRIPTENSEQAARPLPASAAPTQPIEPPAPQVTPPPVPATAAETSIFTAGAATLELPILPGKSDLSALTQSIAGDGKLPLRESVRPDEILNNFPLRLHGTAAIARGGSPPWHPDQRDSGMSAHLATVSTETIACPWKPSATLLLISVRSGSLTDCDLKLSFHPDPANVARYRLLGFPSKFGTPRGNPPTRLPAGAYTTLAIEIEATTPGSELGTLEWSANDKPAPTISLKHRPDAEPSDDARFGALVCAWSQWLTGGGDREMLASLTRENTSTTLSSERAELIKLIEKSLKL